MASHSITVLVNFNTENPKYDAVLHCFRTKRDLRREFVMDHKYYRNDAPITCVADFRIYKKEEDYLWRYAFSQVSSHQSMVKYALKMGTQLISAWHPDGCIVLQFRGVDDKMVRGVKDFGEVITERFDLSC